MIFRETMLPLEVKWWDDASGESEGWLIRGMEGTGT